MFATSYQRMDFVLEAMALALAQAIVAVVC